MNGQGTQRRRKIVEKSNSLSRVHERYRQTTDRRQTTDGRTTTYSEREREFTFAKNPDFRLTVTGRKLLAFSLLSYIAMLSVAAKTINITEI